MENKIEAFELLGQAAHHLILNKQDKETINGIYRAMKQILLTMSDDEIMNLKSKDEQMSSLIDVLEKVY